MKYFFGVTILWTLLSGCGSLKYSGIVKEIENFENEFKDHTGFVLYDPLEDKQLVSYNAHKYFIPASNTKVLTLYTSMHIIGDLMPALYYIETGDSLIFWGTGDPTFLNKNLPQNGIFDFLKKSTTELYFSSSNFKDKRLGPGWAWDDYYYDFSTEKSSFPIYGNVIDVFKTDSYPYLKINQPYFKQLFTLGDTIDDEGVISRDLLSNKFTYEPGKKSGLSENSIPFKFDPALATVLLSDTLSRNVTHTLIPLPEHYNTFSGLSADTVYKQMMQESDNFIAEQLLLVCSGLKFDKLDSEKLIEWALDSLVAGAPDEFIWKDGSGLSRYNLVTPASMVWLWHQLLKEMDKNRLFELLAVGGESGTLENYFRSNSPYIFGKTGTLSNNHNLSGFLITRKGKLLIFSFMNNNYPTKSYPIKKKMEKILWDIHVNN